MTVVTNIAIGLLAVAAVLCVVRALRPGTVIDRAIALDGVVSAIMGGIAAAAVRADTGVFLDIALVGGLLGFLTLSTLARYIGRRGL